MKILGKRVLIERTELAPTTSSMIEIVKYDEQPSHFGVVVEVGQGVTERLTRGDIVVTKLYAGAPYKDNQVFVMEDDILAVLEV